MYWPLHMVLARLLEVIQNCVFTYDAKIWHGDGTDMYMGQT